MSIVNLQAVFWLSKDSLMIAHALGLDVVGSYNTAFRILQSVFLLVVGSLGASLWPAYADAFARGDDGWIRRNLRRSLIGATGTMFGFAICFVPFGEQLLTWYAGRGMALPTSELAWMGVYFVTLTVVNVLSFPLMGIGKLGIIAWGGLIGGALSLPIGVLALHRYGISGLIITNLTCVVFAILAPLIWKIHELRLAWRDGRHDNRFRND